MTDDDAPNNVSPETIPMSITCPRCKRTSYNPNDVLNKYCGACHAYHPEKEKRVLREEHGYDKINPGWIDTTGLIVLRGQCLCGDPKCDWSCPKGANQPMNPVNRPSAT